MEHVLPLQASLLETLVLPNCESIPMPWMLAEKDDWVPRKDAPFIWLNREPSETRSHGTATASAQPEEAVVLKADVVGKKALLSSPESSKGGSEESTKTAASAEEEIERPVAEPFPLLTPAGESFSSMDENRELRKPLLVAEKVQEDGSSESSRVGGSPQYTSLRAVIPAGDPSAAAAAAAAAVGEDAKRKSGRRARMMDFGKRMGDKLEEKRRTIEEKGRHIVEKMRENARTNSLERTSSS